MKPIKVGYLKCDLYNFSNYYSGYSGIHYSEPYGDFWQKTKEEMEAIVSKFQNCFQLIAKKGDRFFCCQYEDEDEVFWYSEDNNCEDLDDRFAQKYLENIQNCKDIFDFI